MGLTVNHQKVKKVTVNRQPSNMENFNRQPSIKSGIINRQTSFIKDCYSCYYWNFEGGKGSGQLHNS